MMVITDRQALRTREVFSVRSSVVDVQFPRELPEFYQQRQQSITGELLDIVSGFETLTAEERKSMTPT